MYLGTYSLIYHIVTIRMMVLISDERIVGRGVNDAIMEQRRKHWGMKLTKNCYVDHAFSEATSFSNVRGVCLARSTLQL